MQKYILILFLFSYISSFSQSNVIKPLLKADSVQIEEEIKNAEQQKIAGNIKEQSRHYNNIANIYWTHNYLTQAASYFEKSITLNQKLNNQSGISMLNNDLGLIYNDLGQFDKAYDAFHKNFEYKRQLNDKRGSISTLINISIVLNNQKKYDQAIKGLLEALEIAQEFSDINQMKSCYGLLSETYEKAKQPENAIKYFTLYKSFHDKIQKDVELENQRKFRETALKLKLTEIENKNKELELKLAGKELKEKDIELSKVKTESEILYSNLSNSEMRNKLLGKDKKIADINATKQKAKIYTMLVVTILAILVLVVLIAAYYQKRKLSLKLLEQYKQIIEQKNEIEKLSIVASKTDNSVLIADASGNVEWVNKGFTKMFGYTIDNLHSKKINIHNLEYIKSSEPEIIKTLQTKKTHVYESLFKCKNNNQKWVQTTLTPIFDEDNEIIKLIFIDSDIQKIKESEAKITQQKEQIEKQQISLTDSINYAQYIQEAILYKNLTVSKIAKEGFIMYKPKDVVSGDFYWFSKIKDKTVIVVSDCTGHGVPGAFLSLIGVNILNQIVEHNNIFMPDEILHKLHDGFLESLNQNTNENTDGMDVAVCTIDKKNNTMYFAGANRPLIYIKNEEIRTIRGDINSVGGLIFQQSNHRNFTLHKIDISNPTSVYLCSDGYADQFGGNRNKKFNNANFYNLINKVKNKPFDQQKIDFENTFERWKGNTKQIDDVMVLGIKI